MNKRRKPQKRSVVIWDITDRIVESAVLRWPSCVRGGIDWEAHLILNIYGQFQYSCQQRRPPDIESQERMTTEVAAWERQRNKADATVDWQFTTADARVKLKKLYPVIQM